MDARVISARTKDGKVPLIILYTECGGERTKYTICEGTYREIGCPLSGEIINEEKLNLVSAEDERRRAMIKALSILSYTDNNEKRLYTKLLMAGFSKEAAADSVRECVRLGYVDEKRQIRRLIEKHSAELLGPHKIAYKLVSKGYSQAAVFREMESLESEGAIDFERTKAELVQKKLPSGASHSDKLKLLYKYGYRR